MAALPYMQLYIADYLADTMHLSTEEHGAYLLLMFNYWQTGKPIPKSRLARIARLSNDRWISVESSLAEFFTDAGTEWVHERIERDLKAVRASLEQKTAAGKASAAARKAKNATDAYRKGNERSTPVASPLQQKSNGKPTNKDPDPDIKDPPLSPPKQRRVQKFDPLVIELPEWLSPDLWREWVEFCQQLKKPLATSKEVSVTLKNLDDLRLSGYTPAQVIRESIVNEGQGLFEPTGGHYAEQKHATQSHAVRKIRAAREAWERERQGVEPVGDHG